MRYSSRISGSVFSSPGEDTPSVKLSWIRDRQLLREVANSNRQAERQTNAAGEQNLLGGGNERKVRT